jgi:hypothetical protein
MPKKLIYTLSLSAFSMIILITSCVPGSCFEETNAFVKATFYNDTTGAIAAPDSLTLYGAGRDSSFLYHKSRNVTQALLPLDAGITECSMVLIINGITDTVNFRYTSYPRMLSKECGYTFFHSLEDFEFTKNIIDTITVTKNTITTFSEENIRIYY